VTLETSNNMAAFGAKRTLLRPVLKTSNGSLLYRSDSAVVTIKIYAVALKMYNKKFST